MKQVMQVIDQNSSPGDGIIHQGVIDNWGIETFFISLRYNQRKFKDYLWRSEKLPFYFGRPFMPQDAIMTDLDKCTHHQRLWVLTINFGRSTDEQGLPICPEKNELYLKISSVTPDQLWSELKQRGFLLKTLEKYDRLLLCQFVKSEG
jgi:hypothetical protein